MLSFLSQEDREDELDCIMDEVIETHPCSACNPMYLRLTIHLDIMGPWRDPH